MFNIRDQGFGLNFNRGFGGRAPAAFGSTGVLEAQQRAADALGQEAAARNQRAIAGMQQQGETHRARIAAQASTLPARLANQRFQQVMPMIQGQLSQALAPIGGQSPPSPGITVGPVWSPDQIQQQVNAARASNDATLASRQQQMRQQVAGRGFGSNSPLAQALGVQLQGQNLSANAEAGREIPWQAAQGNAQQLLRSEQARETQFANRQQEDIERRRMQMTQANALLAALAGLA